MGVGSWTIHHLDGHGLQADDGQRWTIPGTVQCTQMVQPKCNHDALTDDGWDKIPLEGSTKRFGMGQHEDCGLRGCGRALSESWQNTAKA